MISAPRPNDPRRASAWRLAAAFTAAWLAGCGGGGSDEAAPAANATSATPTPTPPAPAPAPAPAPTPNSTGTCNLPDFSATLLSRVNQYRAAGASCGGRGAFPAAAALTWNLALTRAADGHSLDMVANNFFSHAGSNGSNAGQRITAAGYSWASYGENIAAGQGNVISVVDAWMGSEGHCANIMNAGFADIGVACVPGTQATSYRTYWTMNLGRSR